MVNTAGEVLAGRYEWGLVWASVLISVMAAYAALDLAGRVARARGSARAVWLGGGAVAMGMGIWSMHYVGMLAFRLPVEVKYDWPTVMVSLLAAVAASAIALFVGSRKRMRLLRAGVGSVFMGCAIAGMHYIGMAAMRLRAECHYSQGMVIASVALGIAISFVAMWLTFYFRGERGVGWRKAGSVLVMGAAIPTMHYTGMAAVTFTSSSQMCGSVAHALSIGILRAVGIAVVTFLVLGLTVITAVVDRRFSAQTLELEASEKRSRQILATSFDAFVGMDSDGRVADWNAQAEKIFGWSQLEMKGQHLALRIIPPGSRKEYQRRIAGLLEAAGAAATVRFEIAAQCKDGRKIPVEITVSSVRDENEAHLAAFMRDLSKRKKFEQDLCTAKENAVAANEAKSVFLATMSHEIRTPMNGILGMAELVLDTELTVEQREHLGLVKTSAESLLTIINDILDFSKIEAGRLEMESITFGLRASIGETIKALRLRAHQKGLELIFDVRENVAETVVGDPGRIRQILMNLVGNAIKFTGQGQVRVSVEEERSEGESTLLHFAVKDTGIGVTQEQLSKIFEPFSQADGSMARKYGGTGLGLTISKRLVELMGGRIWMESAVGVGSTVHFVVVLGVQRKRIESKAGMASAKSDAHKADDGREERPRWRVLLAEDNTVNQKLAVRLLEKHGCTVTVAVNGGKAVAEWERGEFELILMDVQMPEVDGFEATGMIRAMERTRGGHVPIVALTAHALKGDEERCLAAGMDGYVSKPVLGPALYTAMEKAMEGREVHEEFFLERRLSGGID